MKIFILFLFIFPIDLFGMGREIPMTGLSVTPPIIKFRISGSKYSDQERITVSNNLGRNAVLKTETDCHNESKLMIKNDYERNIPVNTEFDLENGESISWKLEYVPSRYGVSRLNCDFDVFLQNDHGHFERVKWYVITATKSSFGRESLFDRKRRRKR